MKKHPQLSISLSLGLTDHDTEKTKRACVFLKWLKMVIIPFCTFLQRSRKTSTYEGQGQIWSPKPCLNHETRIKTILDHFRNKHAR